MYMHALKIVLQPDFQHDSFLCMRARSRIGKEQFAYFSLVCNFLFHIDLNGTGKTFLDYVLHCSLCSLAIDVCWYNAIFGYDVPRYKGTKNK